jgi:EAL domain-containing protein (putative c-di-GMP-specific phosphodiesterase class I)
MGTLRRFESKADLCTDNRSPLTSLYANWDDVDDDRSRSIDRSLIFLSRDLGTTVVAKGIETPNRLEFLQLNECNEGQGNFIGMPKLASEIEPYLSDPKYAIN